MNRHAGGTDEFIEPEQDLDPDGVEWLGGDEDEDELVARPAAVPGPATRRRLAGSLVLIAAVLAATGYGVNAVYQRDLAADAAANVLVLQTPAGPGLSLPDLGVLSAAGTWSVQPRTAVAVPLVNLSPDPVTLLPGATLLGEGLSGSSLGAASAVTLRPGQSTVLRGSVVANCDYGRPDTGAAAAASLQISADTSGGGLGVSSVPLGSAGGSVRDRICAAQHGAEADLGFEQSLDTRTRSLVLTFSADSRANVPLDYSMVLSLESGPDFGADPQVNGPLTGVLAPGASTTIGFTFPAADCPTRPAAYSGPGIGPDSASVSVTLSIDGTEIATTGMGGDISELINQLCG